MECVGTRGVRSCLCHRALKIMEKTSMQVQSGSADGDGHLGVAWHIGRRGHIRICMHKTLGNTSHGRHALRFTNPFMACRLSGCILSN